MTGAQALLRQMQLTELSGLSPGNGCLSHGWSIISSAPANSQLAGVLAGFIVVGVTILIGRPITRNAPAFGLLCVAFVVLVFDSYLFSLVSGGDSDPYCARVWSEGMPASGMLAVGGLAVVTAITWILASRPREKTQVSSDERGYALMHISLDRIARFMAHGVAAALMLLLAATTFDYLRIIYPTHIPPALIYLVAVSSLAVLAISSALTAYRSMRQGSIWVDRISSGSLATASYGVLAYAVVSPLFAGVTINLPPGVWQTASSPVTAISLSLGLFVPSFLLIALVQSVAPATYSAKSEDFQAVTDDSATSTAKVGYLGDPPKSSNVQQQLDMKWLIARRESYLRDHYLGMHVTVVSVALATAGVTAASLISRHALGIHLGLLWLFWGDSLLAVAVAYGGTMVGAFALPASLPSILDLVLPIAMGVMEFLLFAILIEQITQSHIRFETVITAWLILMLIFLFVAGISVIRARHLFDKAIREQVYAPDVSPVIRTYINGLRVDISAICALSAILIIAVVSYLLDHQPIAAPYVAGTLTGLGITASLFTHSRVVRMWQKNLK